MGSGEHLATARAAARDGRYADALTAADASLSAAPGDADALTFKAHLLVQLGEGEGAVAAAQAAIARAPGNASALAALGGAQQLLGRMEEAEAAFDRALALRPGAAATLVNRGNLRFDLGRNDEALADYDAALAVDPRQPIALANRARVLRSLLRNDEALASAEAAIALQPGYAKAWERKGEALAGLERPAEALAAHRTALSLNPASEGARLGIGQALRLLGRYDEAIAALDEAEALGPDDGMAPFERSLARLAIGDFARGWADYEARWRTAHFNVESQGFATPELRRRMTLAPSRADLRGARAMVVGEQGIGDQLMHASVLPEVLADAAAVTWIADRRLHRLLKSSYPALTLLDLRDDFAPIDLKAFDRFVAAGSLPHAYRRDLAAFPGTPYVQPAPAALQAWSARLGPGDGRLRVGLSWRGGLARTGLARRSMPLRALAPLLALPNCTFVSLQYGDVAEELAQAGGALRAFPPADTDDFEDLAALIANLDLVVSVQTAVAHLSGALGQACLAMVPQRPEWRYGAAGETMPWYRSVRILRQSDGDWGPVIAAVTQAVAARAG